MAAREIAYAVGSAASQGFMTGVWIAAGELSPAKRRAVRFATGAAFATLGFLGPERPEKRPGNEEEHTEEGAEPQPVDRRRLAVSAAVGVLSLGALVGRHRLEKLWLARLQRNGHPHPYRALGVRMGLVAAAIALPSRLQEIKR
jgi:hypothetical protein